MLTIEKKVNLPYELTTQKSLLKNKILNIYVLLCPCTKK